MLEKIWLRRKRSYNRIKTGVRFSDRFRLLIHFLLSLFITWSLCYRFDILHGFMNFIVKGIQIKSLGYVWEIGHYRDFLTVEPEYEGLISEWFNHGSDIFLDVGSYIGRYSIFLNERFKKIYSFEPSSKTYNRLCENISLNEIRNIHPVRIALMDFDGSMSMNLKNSPGTNSLIHEENSLSSEIVDTVRLDTFYFKGKVDLIKVDIEGAEKEFLRGAREIIRVNKPRLIIEIEPKNLDFIKDLMSSMGYAEVFNSGVYHCYDQFY